MEDNLNEVSTLYKYIYSLRCMCMYMHVMYKVHVFRDYHHIPSTLQFLPEKMYPVHILYIFQACILIYVL